MSKKYTLAQSQDLPITLEQAWDFFSNPNNLAKITPASLGFVIVSNPPVDITDGLKITYTVKPLLGIQTEWVSLISDVRKYEQFVDQQLKGPYASWHHLHRFTKILGGVRAEDVVTYSLPMGLLGELVHPVLVAPRLKEIFDFRRTVLINQFGEI